MLHLDSVILHNFKSFRHASVKFSDGFNCIIGPNGSGKSVICDSLLFALGEGSLKRMRVSSLAGLIHNSPKSKPRTQQNAESGRQAYVKLTLSGDEPLEIMRVIKSNNKVGYRLNGKHTTRQAIIDALRANRSELNETNTIAQGEIIRMLTLNAKETRGLIDVAAGIREFDDKKSASLKELDKVETRITEADIMLNERQGFLTELEKEKDDAERYIKMTRELKSANYTLLKGRESAISSEYDRASAELMSREKSKADISAKLKGTDLDIEKLSSEREKLSKSLNERSMELSSTNRMLEEVSSGITIRESQLKAIADRRSELDAQSTRLKSERAEIEVLVSKKTEDLEKKNVELDELSKVITSKGEPEYDSESDAALDRVGENQKRFDTLESELRGVSDLQMSMALDHNNAVKESESTMARITQLEAQKTENSTALAAASARAKNASSGVRSARSSLDHALATAKSARLRIDEIYAESVNLREQLAVYGSSATRGDEAIRKHVGRGFHGRAYELCSYEDKYALAVQAAASSRLNYFIVASVDDADRAISLMKSKRLGRASFIPLNEISNQADPSRKDPRHMLNFVKFDKRYERAFSYIFSNTLLVKDIAEAKASGIRSHRYVTLDGEIVERSGVVTGGTLRAMRSPAFLTSKLNALESEKSDLTAKLSAAESDVDKSRSEISTLQAELAEADSEIKRLSASISAIEKEYRDLSPKASSVKERVDKLQSEMEKLSKKKSQLSALMQSVREETERIYTGSPSTSHSIAERRKSSKAKVEELKSLRSRAEQLKISIATLSKECEMHRVRTKAIDAELESIRGAMASSKMEASRLNKEIATESERKAMLQGKMKSHDAESTGMYKRMQEFESKIASLSMEKGRTMSEFDKLTREAMELSMSKAQLQTRINDIRAELMSYQGTDPCEERDVKRLESRIAVLKSELEKLGAVNMKAPEIYEQKKGDVEAAHQKLSTLNNEKSAIISMINEIESKKLNIFNETLSSVNENFKRLYNYIFEGSAYLYLQNPKDPFGTGLHINITSGKGASRSSEQLSGGEKSLLMLMLIFAIQMRNPMSFYIFDEIDSALDKENSKKLSKLIKELGKRSQMIVVSHNDSMITAADAAIGVAHRKGESQAVGIQVSAKPEQVLLK